MGNMAPALRCSRTYDVVQEVRLAGCHALAAIHVHVHHMHMQVIICARQSEGYALLTFIATLLVPCVFLASRNYMFPIDIPRVSCKSEQILHQIVRAPLQNVIRCSKDSASQSQVSRCSTPLIA